MSGIFGIVDQRGIEVDILPEVSRAIVHRGPDDEGYVLFTADGHQPCAGESTITDLHLPSVGSAKKAKFQAALLHRRLATIDVTASGHQPMSYRNGELWITFDGAIYNYIELKEELIARHYKFLSNSDTEVILAAYCEWGPDCVDKFNGMWALAIWDNKAKCLFLSRDRFAEKPLYYYHKDGRFIFASEIKAIRTYLKNDLPIAAGVERYARLMDYHVGQTCETMFADVVQLPHSHSLVLRNNTAHIYKYYTFTVNEKARPIGENIEIFKELFLDSLKLRFRADVEVGACLSGGQDSSAIISYASAKLNRKITTVSSVFPGFESDESSYIDAVIKKHGCQATKFVPDISALFAATDSEIYHQECPIDHINSLTQWLVMKKAKEIGLKVVLDGQGSDELTAGYPWLLLTFFREMLFHFKFGSILNNRDMFKRWNYTPIVALRSLKHYFASKINQDKALMFASLNENLKYLLDVSSIPYFFHFGDRASMAHSVEDRCPFVDHRMVEFLYSVPADQKIRNSMNKFILREAMKDYIPREVYERTGKIGQMSITPIEVKFGAELAAHFDAGNMGYLREYHVVSDYAEIKNLPLKTRFKFYTLARFIKIFG